MYYPDSAILVTGLAKVGKEDVISNVYGNFALSLVIDTTTGIILELGCSMVLPETVDFIRYLVAGKHISDMDKICAAVHSRFFGLAQKAVIAALKDAQNRYLMAMENRN